MNFKSLALIAGVVAGAILFDAHLVEARGFGTRGGFAVRLGIGGARNSNIRYSGPGFYAAPRTFGSNRQGATQFQQRPWYYSRSGQFEYYRPYSPLYSTR